MAKSNHIIKAFTKATHNKTDNEDIPMDAAQDSMNWVTNDDRIELVRGREYFGEEGTVGKNTGLHFGIRNDGGTVAFQKVGEKIQYYDTSTNQWEDVITGLTADADYSFTNYVSLAGNFTFAVGADGIFKIHVANPDSYINLTDDAINFKGHAFIDRGRMILWGRTEDKTGLYGSWIDAQDSTVYTTVTGEVAGTGDGVETTFTHTLAFKSGGSKRNCFGIVINIPGTPAIVLKDNFNGQAIGEGATATINYTTGELVIETEDPVGLSDDITVDYQWENSNDNGVTDFTYSEPREASEGFMFRQDEGGDAILKVEIGQDGAYYSMKQFSVYRLELDATDENAINLVFRKDIGIPSNRASVSTGSGIVFINTANPERPVLTILSRNKLGESIEPFEIANHYDFAQFNYSDCALTTYGQWVVIACRTQNSTYNNRLLLVDVQRKRVDTLNYTARTFAKSRDEFLYAGDSVTLSSQKLFSGFDDLDLTIENYWIGKGETYNIEDLKKVKRLVFQGLIDINQTISVYLSEDDGEFYLAGTIRGDAEYVDFSRQFTVGSSMVGSIEVGGETPEEQFVAYRYFREIKIKTSKFRKITMKFVANGIGFCSINYAMQKDILFFEQRIPKKFRVKQNENLSGTESDLPLPEFN